MICFLIFKFDYELLVLFLLGQLRVTQSRCKIKQGSHCFNKVPSHKCVMQLSTGMVNYEPWLIRKLPGIANKSLFGLLFIIYIEEDWTNTSNCTIHFSVCEIGCSKQRGDSKKPKVQIGRVVIVKLCHLCRLVTKGEIVTFPRTWRVVLKLIAWKQNKLHEGC